MKTINNQKLREMIQGGYKYLAANKAMVDSLNVFPVPDGDTGTNMSLTMLSAVKEVENTKQDDLSAILNAYAKGALKGARGNSGVILSQIIRGITKTLDEEQNITTKTFAQSLVTAREIAYNAVTKPKEGTVLTVIRVMSEYAPSIAVKNQSFISFFENLLRVGEDILQKTPDMLPVLKKAGVVDAGGRGLMCVFQGFYNILAGIEIPEEIEIEDSSNATPVMDQFGNDEHDLENIKYAYCTEYFVTNLKPTLTEEDVEKLRDKLMAIGDCVIVIGDISLIKVHVHTNQPNKALMYALQLGELDKVKIENMLQQNRALLAEREANKKPIGVITICAGEGIAKIFKDLSVDEVIEGGQTMNPSVEDIARAIKKVNADNIIVLPNNKNIIMAADKASELTDKNVYVIPTTEVAEGIRSALVFDPECSVEDNVEEMKSAYKNIACGEVTHAVRATKLDGFKLKVGDIIGLDGKTIVAKGDTVNQTVEALLDKLITDETEAITLYYGEDVKEEDALALQEKLEEKYDEMDVVMYNGGQPHYYYFVSVE